MIAHLSYDRSREQSVQEHNHNVGKLAGSFLERVRLSATGCLAGDLHDIGKLTEAFENYIRNGGRKGSVIHTFTPVRYLMERFHGPDGTYGDMAAEIIAYACGAHHASFDCIGLDGKSGFKHRIDSKRVFYGEAIENLYKLGISDSKIRDRLKKASEEVQRKLEVLSVVAMRAEENERNAEFSFYAGMLARLVQSAVVDADRQDTAEFMDQKEYPDSMTDEALRAMWCECVKKLEIHVSNKKDHGDITRARKAIADACRAMSDEKPGVFRFYAKCGAGKTLSSALFAVLHTCGTDVMERIFFVAPRLSIIDQNVKEIRECFGTELVLECDSNVSNERIDADGNKNEDYKENYKQLSETWRSPVVVTSAVQFLECLFGGSMTSIRRFHALCRSVIIIDEVQAIPRKMTSMFNMAVNFLVVACGSSVVLCSATQPKLEATKHGIRLDVKDMCPEEIVDDKVFDRTRLKYEGVFSCENVADLAAAELDRHRSALVVCNKKQQALDVYNAFEGRADKVYHISASMCMAHRIKVLKQMKMDLEAKDGRTVLCAATQVLEAGVDISFDLGYRVLAGLDSCIQTAGRVNRNGNENHMLGTLHLVRLEEEGLGRLKEIQEDQRAMIELLAEFEKDPVRFECRLDSSRAIARYYEILNRIAGYCHDYNIPEAPDGMMAHTLFDLLSLNRTLCRGRNPGHSLWQAFAIAGREFQVFDSGAYNVIVQYGRGKEIIEELNSEEGHKEDMRFLWPLLKEARHYTISLFKYQVDLLRKQGAILDLPGGAMGLMGHYDDDVGFVIDKVDMPFFDV